MEKSGLEEECKAKNEMIAVKQQEITAKETALSKQMRRVNSMIDECAKLKGQQPGRTEKIRSLSAHNRSLEEHVKVMEVWQNI